jgi:hypothetical protein
MKYTISELRNKAGSAQVALVRVGNVNFIVLNTKVNSINFEFIALFHKILDEIESSSGPGIIVTINT